MPTPTHDVRVLFNQIKDQTAKRFGHEIKTLNAPVQAKILTELEKLVGSVPRGYHTLLQLHDGSTDHEDDNNEFLIHNYGFVAVEEVIRTVKNMTRMLNNGTFKKEISHDKGDARVKPGWWNTKWIPFLQSGDHFYCLDMDPAASGKAGQVIHYGHGLAERKVMADSIETFLQLSLEWAIKRNEKFDEYKRKQRGGATTESIYDKPHWTRW